MFARTAVAALFAGLAAAQHAPVGEPNGNPINRPLTEIVPACKEFTILWQPTTPNSVSLVLLRGPAENIKPLSTIVTGITNSGSFKWTPSSGLEADTTHYGLQIIDDVTGQYQYSNQFGISKGPECDDLAPSSAASTPYGGGYPVSTSALPSKASSSMGYPVSTPISTPVFTKANITMTTKASSVVLSTGVPAGNSTIIQPTRPLSVPSSLRPTASGSASPTVPILPESTGAASSLHAGLSLVGAAAAFAFIF
ncbi:Ser-Thr-rich glycosyl-phosphatidyl-inositol-anchored membrane family-domain-containing protein [Ampelomyces quisqualis]|uniref:Ser-Thr-rich glycosyl-phosphatidyl-inositol-anchored membrane family-domain-containing protein n=1 Tax=Ampelomyces quisqualis TaxID=50730 RepID=A0A6A5QNR5_AMPQU|nr:Ser-Thr-rich glycosyl-phosphatidyl-inositol-anchored membrane family-domain-containing protein [Ampelomyces quisqualis]